MMKSPYQEPKLPEFVTEEGFGRFTKKDIVLLRTFKDNELLIKLLRKTVLQLPFEGNEFDVISKVFNGNDDLFLAVKNVFEPIGEDVVLLGGTRWSDRKYGELSATDAKCLVLSRKDSIKFISNGIDRLEQISKGGQGQPLEMVIDFGMKGDYENANPEDIKRRVVAFQDSMIFLDNCFMTINIIVSKEDETPEQREERLAKDSSK